MWVDTVAKLLTYYDMTYVFQIIPSLTLETLENCLEVVFSYQTQSDLATAYLFSGSSTDTTVIAAEVDTDKNLAKATQQLNDVKIAPINLV